MAMVTDPSSESRKSITTEFIDGLHELDAGKSGDRLIGLFADRAEIKSLSKSEQGNGGPRRFWSRYRAQFGDIRTAFSRVVEQDDTAVLVWRSEGTLASGNPVAYDGVSILTIADGRISRFETIYDSAAFLPVKAG